MNDSSSPYAYRSLFWPIVLIGFGVVMLLANLDLIPTPSFGTLLRLWPLALVILGLDILIGRRSPLIGALIGFAVLALMLLLLYVPASVKLPGPERKSITLNTPLGESASAEVTIALERYATTLDASTETDDLFEALLETYTDVDFTAQGSQRKTVSLRPAALERFPGDWTLPTSDMTWQIALSPQVPIDLSVDVGSGSARLELFDLMLEGLHVDGGSGRTELQVPAAFEPYRLAVDGGSGSFDIEIEDQAQLEAAFDVGSGSFRIAVGSGVEMTLAIEGGSGSITIQLPHDAAVRLVVEEHGSGAVHVPAGFTLLDDLGDNDGDTGIWETTAGATEALIEIRFDPGSGSLRLR